VNTGAIRKTGGTEREPELDALRGMAALFVVLFHYAGLAKIDLPFFKLGVTGVDLFFLISGYVIFLTLNKITKAKEFIITRFLRLFPTYLLIMTVTLLVIYFLSFPSFPSVKVIAGNATMLQPFCFVPYIDDVYWTLTVELEFYILMLVLFQLGMLDKIEWVGLVLIIIFLGYHYIGYTFFRASRIYISPRAFIPVISHFQLFFAGIIFYKIKKIGNSMFRTFLILCCFAISLYLFKDSGKSHFFLDVWQYTAILAFYFVVFFMFAYRRIAFIAAKPLIFLGAISYCLYLIHGKAGLLLHPFLSGTLHTGPASTVFLLLIIMIFISYMVTFNFERPLIKYLRGKWLVKPSALTNTDIIGNSVFGDNKSL